MVVQIRGFTGNSCPEIGLRPSAGELLLPALTVDESAYRNNRDLFHRYVRAGGAEVAPHAKTPMCVDIARDLIDAGSWGATVANLQQAQVMLQGGVGRILIANGLGGSHNIARVADLCRTYPGADIIFIADSPQAASILGAAAKAAGRPLKVLVEVGAGRTGARTLEAAEAVAMAIRSQDKLVLAGVSAYEGAVNGPTEEARAAGMDRLFDLMRSVHRLTRQLNPDGHLLLSAGGSLFFDRVVSALCPLAAEDRNTTVLLRSGAIFFHDHGIYKKGLAAMDGRHGFRIGAKTILADQAFFPALKVWAEVLSLPEEGMAICGFGMRDTSFDQGLPVPIGLFRNGQELDSDFLTDLHVFRLNDQHAFLRYVGPNPLELGDIIAFGISHPCTCFDRWRRFFMLSDDGKVLGDCKTSFS